jgi:hypothetical protein
LQQQAAAAGPPPQPLLLLLLLLLLLPLLLLQILRPLQMPLVRRSHKFGITLLVHLEAAGKER